MIVLVRAMYVKYDTYIKYDSVSRWKTAGRLLTLKPRLHYVTDLRQCFLKLNAVESIYSL